jgi:hypothetical protein
MDSVISATSLVYLAIPGIKLTKKHKIVVGTRVLKDSENTHAVLSTYLTTESLKRFSEEHPAAYFDLCQGKKDYELRTSIIEALKSAKKPTNLELPFDMTVPVSLKKVRLINIVENIDQSFLYDPDTEKVYTQDRKHILAKLKQHFPDDDERAKWMAEHTDDRVLRYKPYYPKTFTDVDGRLCFNKWVMPNYMVEWEYDASVETLPEDFEKVFKHTFVVDFERDAVLCWMRNAVFSREETVLTLTGIQGSGKGVFFQHVLGNLVGQENLTKAAPNFESSEFHGDLREKTIYVLNELTLTKKIKNKLKEFADGKSTINEKNIKTSGSETLYASFIVVNNYPSNNYLEYADRKFLVPALSDFKLDESFGEEWVTNFCKNIATSPEFLRQLASYLWFKVPAKIKYPKTELFYQICEMQLHWYLKKFLLMCKHKSEFTDRDLSRGNRGMKSLNVYELQEMLRIYERETRKKVADLSETVSGWVAVSKICTETKDDNAV